MREIKFRGLDRSTGKWAYGGLMIFKDGTVTMGVDEMDDKIITSPVDPETVGQYTGLKDKNGVEIYEGDILQYPNEKCIGVVKFGIFSCLIGGDDWNGGNGFYLDRIDQYNQSGLMDCKNLTIIGNIHQNPELL